MSKVIIMESKADQFWSALISNTSKKPGASVIINDLPGKEASQNNRAFQEAQRQKAENDNKELL